MGENLIDWFRLLWDSGRQLREQGAAIEELEEKTQYLVEIVQALNVENSRLHDKLQHERELRESHSRELELRLRLQIAEELRRLPPPSQ